MVTRPVVTAAGAGHDGRRRGRHARVARCRGPARSAAGSGAVSAAPRSRRAGERAGRRRAGSGCGSCRRAGRRWRAVAGGRRRSPAGGVRRAAQSRTYVRRSRRRCGAGRCRARPRCGRAAIRPPLEAFAAARERARGRAGSVSVSMSRPLRRWSCVALTRSADRVRLRVLRSPQWLRFRCRQARWVAAAWPPRPRRGSAASGPGVWLVLAALASIAVFFSRVSLLPAVSRPVPFISLLERPG